MVSILSTARRYGSYGANFLLGTGAEAMGKKIGQSVKVRSKTGMSLPKAVGYGFKKGFAESQKGVAKLGFLHNIAHTFQGIGHDISAAWKGSKGLKKLSGLKSIGKAMPLIMNVLWLAQSVPDIVSRTKDEGILGGLKETGKTLANMAIISVESAAGAALFGLPGTILAPMAVSMLTTPIIGEPYSVKKQEAAEAQKQAQVQQQTSNPFMSQPVAGSKLDVTSYA